MSTYVPVDSVLSRLPSRRREELADYAAKRAGRWQYAQRRHGVSGPLTRADLARLAR